VDLQGLGPIIGSISHERWLPFPEAHNEAGREEDEGLDRTEAEMGCWWIVGEGVWCAVGRRIRGRGKERCIICIG
jgi:hypothetical protein